MAKHSEIARRIWEEVINDRIGDRRARLANDERLKGVILKLRKSGVAGLAKVGDELEEARVMSICHYRRVIGLGMVCPLRATVEPVLCGADSPGCSCTDWYLIDCPDCLALKPSYRVTQCLEVEMEGVPRMPVRKLLAAVGAAGEV